jgi:DHA2 family multidrug resistance protein
MSKGLSAVPLIVTGFILFAAYAWLTASVSPDVGKWDFFFPLAIRSFGISMVMLPLINQAVAGLAPKDYASGISLNNMIRQLGGAFGIAMANNYISNQYAQHRYDMVSKLADGSPQLNERLHSISQNMIAKSGIDSLTATTKAYTMISNAVDRQAYYLSYLDTFRLITIFFILVIPLVVFLKTKKKSPEAAAAALEAH